MVVYMMVMCVCDGGVCDDVGGVCDGGVCM